MRNLSEEEFNKKYYIYKDTIYRIAFTYVHNQSDALDIVQDVFMKYLNSNEVFATDDNEKYWLIRVTINISKNFVSKSWNKMVYLDNEYINNLSSDSEKSEQVNYYKIVTSLKEKYKEVILLYYYEDFSIEEIANILKISNSCVKKRLERGRDEIKKEIKNGRF